MKSALLFALMALYSFSSFALSCKEMESKQDEDGNIAFFTEAKFTVTKSIEHKLVRAAVADFYGKCGVSWNTDYCYRENMTVKQVYELGEDAYFLAYKTPTNKLYLAVNVGFGGGNSATYFFDYKTHRMEKVMMIDGAECSPIQSILGYN